MTAVLNGHDMSGTTAQRPTNAQAGQPFFDTTLGCWVVYDGAAWTPAGNIFSKEITFTETTGAGTYTGSVSVPAGATLVDVIVHGVALWAATTSATMKVGDAADDDGIFTGIDLKATDLLAGEGISAAGVAGSAGGKAGADLANSQWNRRYLATARVVSGIITTVGAAGAAGVTRMTVVYALTGTPVAATKA